MKQFNLRYPKLIMSMATMSAFAFATNSFAQADDESANQSPEPQVELEELVVLGTRRTIQNSIDAKRMSVTIVDARCQRMTLVIFLPCRLVRHWKH